MLAWALAWLVVTVVAAVIGGFAFLVWRASVHLRSRSSCTRCLHSEKVLGHE